MRFSRVRAVAMSTAIVPLVAASVAVDTFPNSSPFLFYSTSELLASPPALMKASSLQMTLTPLLEKCPSDVYVVITQQGLTASDLHQPNFAPHLSASFSGKDKHVRSSFSVAEVVGDLDTSSLVRTLEQKCGASSLEIDATTGLFDMVDNVRPRIVEIEFPALPTDGMRASASRTNDQFISNLLEMLPSPNYTVIYATTPIGEQHSHIEVPTQYHMDNSMSPLVHMDLKRDESFARASGSNDTLPQGPLFERYQYFTPGLFMGLVVGFVLLSILYVGISGIAGLEVSYMAFDKEMGPAAQKSKQQQ